MAVTGRAADSAIPKISACWAFEYRNSCHIQESLDSNVGAFLHLYNLGVAPTGRAADSVIPKLSACWEFEPLHPCHIKESLDSNVGAFLRLYYCSRLGIAATGRAADSVIPKLSAKNHQHRRGYLSILSLLVGKYFIAVFRVKKHNKQ